MRIDAQHTNQLECMNAVRSYGTRTAALLLMTSDEAATMVGLGRVFKIHDAPLLSLDENLDWGLKSVGDCIIRPDGIKVVVEGSPTQAFMGMLFEIDWNHTDQAWRDAAEANGCVWLSLLDFVPFDRVRNAGFEPAVHHRTPTLKLDVVP